MKWEFYDLEGHGYVNLKKDEFCCVVDQWAGEHIEDCCQFKDWRERVKCFWKGVINYTNKPNLRRSYG